MSPESPKRRIGNRIRGFLTRPVDWFRDSVFRRLWQNAAVLLSGNLVSVLFDFVSLVVTARALGPTWFGVFVLIQTYVLVVDNLVNFQSWQAVIKYGADTLDEGDPDHFKSLIKFGTILDIASAIIATVIAIACIFLDFINVSKVSNCSFVPCSELKSNNLRGWYPIPSPSLGGGSQMTST